MHVCLSVCICVCACVCVCVCLTPDALIYMHVCAKVVSTWGYLGEACYMFIIIIIMWHSIQWNPSFETPQKIKPSGLKRGVAPKKGLIYTVI